MFRFASVILLVSAFLFCGCQRTADTDPAGSDPPEQIPSEPAQTVQLIADDYQRAEYLQRRGIGHMENMEWAESETTLSELASLLPDNRTALRNLAIQRVLALTEPNSPYRSSGSQQERQEFSQAVDRAIAAIENYRESVSAAEDQSIANLLHGKVLVHADRPNTPSFDEGVVLLRRAADSQPDRADMRMAVAVALKGNRRYENSSEVLRELARAFELAPNNLHAMRLYLDTLALALRSTDEATRELAATGLRDMLPKVKDLVEPLNESVLRNTRVDLMKTLDAAIAEASKDAGTLMRPAMVVSNTIRSEIPVQIDMRRIDRHLLEFVLPRFDDDFYAAARDAGVESPQPIPC